ncbi:MAG: MBL fold metallo-hydrolase [Chloroflexi bacterium]|nr:MBL fold metallo-hydrolase [Chloroflexota bacterium]
MEITWYGYSCFRITERGHTTVLTDPYQPALDPAQRGLKADLVTISNERAAQQIDAVRGDKYVISAPGEYEIGELFVTGIPLHIHAAESDTALRNIAYHFEYPNSLNFLHLGALHQLPDQSIIEQFDQVHVLLLPIGSALGGDQLADLINIIEPSFVLPMHTADLDKEEFDAALDGFFKAMGVANVEWQDTLRVTAGGLGEQMQVICLLPAG